MRKKPNKKGDCSSAAYYIDAGYNKTTVRTKYTLPQIGWHILYFEVQLYKDKHMPFPITGIGTVIGYTNNLVLLRQHRCNGLITSFQLREVEVGLVRYIRLKNLPINYYEQININKLPEELTQLVFDEDYKKII